MIYFKSEMTHIDLRYFISRSKHFYKVEFYDFHENETVKNRNIKFYKPYKFIISGNTPLENFDISHLFENAFLKNELTYIFKIGNQDYFDFIFYINDIITNFFNRTFKYTTKTNPNYYKLIRLNNIELIDKEILINKSKISFAVHINGREYYEFVNPFLMFDIAFNEN